MYVSNVFILAAEHGLTVWSTIEPKRRVGHVERIKELILVASRTETRFEETTVCQTKIVSRTPMR